VSLSSFISSFTLNCSGPGKANRSFWYISPFKNFALTLDNPSGHNFLIKFTVLLSHKILQRQRREHGLLHSFVISRARPSDRSARPPRIRSIAEHLPPNIASTCEVSRPKARSRVEYVWSIIRLAEEQLIRKDDARAPR
jgi:hypothetical protein